MINWKKKYLHDNSIYYLLWFYIITQKSQNPCFKKKKSYFLSCKKNKIFKEIFQ